MTSSRAVLLLGQTDPPGSREWLEKAWIWCQEGMKATRRQAVCRALLSRISKNAKKMETDI